MRTVLSSIAAGACSATFGIIMSARYGWSENQATFLAMSLFAFIHFERKY